MASCSYIPRNKQGLELLGFQEYRKALGYTTARDVFLKALSPDFQKDFKRYLEFDAQLVPTYNSVMTVPYIKKFVGAQKMAQAALKSFPWEDNTRSDYERLINQAYAFNTTSDNKDNLTAIVEHDNAKIRVKIVPKNENNDKVAADQYATLKLNTRLSEIFSDLGINVGLLEQYEAMRTNGIVDFSKASSMADGFENLIRIANNAEGVQALPEEFSHLIIGIFRDTPLVSRSLNVLRSNRALVQEVLGDEYQSVYDSYDGHEDQEALVAEEALGRVLQEHLLQANERKETDNSSALNRLVSRLVNWIKNVFKKYDINDVIKAKEVINANMDQLSRDFLNGKKTLTKQDIANAARNAKFNHLREDVDNVLQLVQNAIETERKRMKIVGNRELNQRAEINKRIATLNGYVNDKDKLLGLIYYAKQALEDLSEANRLLDSILTMEGDGKFRSLRNIQTILDSYSEFIKDFRKTLNQYSDAQIVDVNGEEVNLNDLWRRLDEQFQSSTTRFEGQVLPVFISFISPIYNISPMRDKNGNIVPLERIFKTATKEDVDRGDILNEDIDINFLDKMGISLANSASVIGQLFDRAVKEARVKVRDTTKNNVREIWTLREKAEKLGITDFEWMFEKNEEGKKTGNYISEYNYGQFEQDYQELLKSLKEKYGESPFGDDYKKYNAERRQWLSDHALNIFGKPEPNESYKNPEFDKLSKALKEVLTDFLNYKSSLEIGLPKNKIDRKRAVQRRRTSALRFVGGLSNPTDIVNNISAEFSEFFNYKERADDDQMYGNTFSGLTDFTGKEFMTVPLLYTNRLKNPDDLSTDVFSDLMVYAYSINEYKELDRIADPLNIGREAVKQKRLLKTRFGKVMQETVNTDGRAVKNLIYSEETQNNLLTKIDEFLESQVYGRYLKPQEKGKVDKQKIVTIIKKLTSTAYLGANYLAGIANVANAVGMQNIEAFAKEWFTAKELLSADKEYSKLLPAYFSEIGDRNKLSKLALFGEWCNLKQDYKEKVGKTQKRNYLQRIFGNNLVFIQQNIGDHWIYNRTAIAMAKHEKVKYKGSTVSVWDVLEVVEDSKTGKKIMRVKEGVKNLDGTDFSKAVFEGKLTHVLQTLVGNYNPEDLVAAKRTAEGRLLFQMRDWMLPLMMRRFQSKRTILATGKEEEGYYRTFGRFLWDLRMAPFNMKTEWGNLNPEERANVIRATVELVQLAALFMLVNFFDWGGDDPDRCWAMKFAEYMANRELHELGFLAPTPLMALEAIKTVQSPFVAASAIADVNKIFVVAMNHNNWTEEVQSGPYKGHSRVAAAVLKAPIPPMTWYKQVNKIFEDLDAGTRFYARDFK